MEPSTISSMMAEGWSLPTFALSATSFETFEGSWHETFAPTLNSDLIKRKKEDFNRFYPTKILKQETLPSARLLSLIHDQLTKKHWSWVPWKYRLSQAKSEELKGQHIGKLPKIEGLSIHELLVDEPSSVEVANPGMGINGVRSILELQNFGIALCNCKGARLGNLRAFSRKFLSLLTSNNET